MKEIISTNISHSAESLEDQELVNKNDRGMDKDGKSLPPYIKIEDVAESDGDMEETIANKIDGTDDIGKEKELLKKEREEKGVYTQKEIFEKRKILEAKMKETPRFMEGNGTAHFGPDSDYAKKHILVKKDENTSKKHSLIKKIKSIFN